MTLMCDSGNAELIIVNPSTTPTKTLARWLNEPQTYFCPRLDGVQTYTLNPEVLDKYRKYDTAETVKSRIDRLHALCSTRDELIGREHLDKLTPVMPSKRLMIVDDFGHQCRDAGMTHLYEILESVAKH